MRGVKGNTKPFACGARRTVRVLVALVVGIGLAGVVWHEELGVKLLGPAASGTGAVTTSGTGQPPSFAKTHAGVPASLGAASSSRVSTHVSPNDPGIAETGAVEGPEQEAEAWAAAIEPDWGQDDDDDGLTEGVLDAGEEEQEEEEEASSSGEVIGVEMEDAAPAVHGVDPGFDRGGDDDDDGMIQALEKDLVWEEEHDKQEGVDWHEHQQQQQEEERVKQQRRRGKLPAPERTEEELAEQFFEECKAEFWERRFLPRGREALPPVLYSFPGSGNTWTRHILDFATGVPTGSIHKLTRPSPLPGQGVCDQRVSVVKAHPNQFRPNVLLDLSKTGPAGRCRVQGSIPGFKRFILLVRNPFDAIWSDYRRKHQTPVVVRDDFDSSGFTAAALKYSRVWVQMVMDFRYLSRALPTEDTFKLTYEDWLDETGRPEILDNLVDFIGLNDDDSRKERRRRLECAFPLAEEAGGGRRGSNVLGRLEDTSMIMTTATVYVPEVACRMWEVLSDTASSLGYGLPNGITEQECKRVMRTMRSA